MNNNRTKHRKFHIAIAVWVALLTGLAFGDEYIAWQHFQTAANSFSEGGDINTIVTLCEQPKRKPGMPCCFHGFHFCSPKRCSTPKNTTAR